MPNNVQVVEVESRAQLRDFITYPNRLYRDDPCYVVPLLSERLEFFDFEKNPFYRAARVRLFLAKRGEVTVGRIATCINYAHNEFHGEKTGFFGFFDCPDDYDVAFVLLKVAMIRLKMEGMEKMRGPMNFSTNHEIGFLVEGFDEPPRIMMPYNPPYLPELAARFGLRKAMDLLAYKLTDETPIPERVETVIGKIRQRGNLVVRPIRLRDFDNEVDRVNQVYNQAWQNNWGFVPMGDAEFRWIARNLRQVIDPDLALLCEHEGRPVAFILGIPDINQALARLRGRLFPLGLLRLLWHTKIR
ncbi:MAG TPA: N-acetyltransferase, partial [candidate division Zixibacteria bacterium]|nr:N-acetyltransferase [candidate division Zixibacteria bacterium]